MSFWAQIILQYYYRYKYTLNIYFDDIVYQTDCDFHLHNRQIIHTDTNTEPYLFSPNRIRFVLQHWRTCACNSLSNVMHSISKYQSISRLYTNEFLFSALFRNAHTHTDRTNIFNRNNNQNSLQYTARANYHHKIQYRSTWQHVLWNYIVYLNIYYRYRLNIYI